MYIKYIHANKISVYKKFDRDWYRLPCDTLASQHLFIETLIPQKRHGMWQCKKKVLKRKKNHNHNTNILKSN